jgi:hypothetical protein
MKSLLIGIAAIIAVGGGAFYYITRPTPPVFEDSGSMPQAPAATTQSIKSSETVATKDVCSYLTASDFTSIGLSSLRQINVDATRHICQYQYGDVHGPISAFGFFPFHGSAGDLDKSIQVYVKNGAKILSGIGDKVVELDTVGNTFVNAMVIFFKKNNTVTVQLAIPGTDMAGASAKAQTLAKIAADKF